jgi:hypothetical protein
MSTAEMPHVYDGIMYTIRHIIDGRLGEIERVRGEELRAKLEVLPATHGIVIFGHDEKYEAWGDTRLRVYRIIHNALDLANHLSLTRPTQSCVHAGTPRTASDIEEATITYAQAVQYGLVTSEGRW